LNSYSGNRSSIIVKVKYIGENFSFAMIDGDVYDCIAIEHGMLRIIDGSCKIENDRIGYLYSALTPGSLFGEDGNGVWEIIEDFDSKIADLIENLKSQQQLNHSG